MILDDTGAAPSHVQVAHVFLVCLQSVTNNENLEPAEDQALRDPESRGYVEFITGTDLNAPTLVVIITWAALERSHCLTVADHSP